MPVVLRSATEADAKHVESLLAELGYPSKEADVRHRLRRSLDSDTSCFLVAQQASEVIGLVSAELVPYFPNGSTICRVTGLVVSTHHRGQGVGEKLVTAPPTSHANVIAQGLRSPVQNIVLTRTGSTSGSGSPEPRSDSSMPYEHAYYCAPRNKSRLKQSLSSRCTAGFRAAYDRCGSSAEMLRRFK